MRCHSQRCMIGSNWVCLCETKQAIKDNVQGQRVRNGGQAGGGHQPNPTTQGAATSHTPLDSTARPSILSPYVPPTAAHPQSNFSGLASNHMPAWKAERSTAQAIVWALRARLSLQMS
eukprot:357504-Chlamydomonas_euryale.AAC.2